MYINNPMQIENKSMDIIEECLGDTSFSELEKIVAKRIIHTTGDVDYRHIIDFRNDFVEKAKEIIKEKPIIYTDTKMANAGINKAATKKLGIELVEFISDPDVFQKAKENGTTRSQAAVDKAVRYGADIYVFGNAPTAAYRLMELMKEGKVKPKLIVCVPVGFVGAAESKEEMRNFVTDTPLISTVGNKGGSNVAASIINAIMYMAVER